MMRLPERLPAGCRTALAAAVLAILAASGAASQSPRPLGLPPVPVPDGNPVTTAKVKLGEKLFFERGLSADRSVSCASCHLPQHSFSDDKPLSRGVNGYLGARNSPTLLNAAYAAHLMLDGRATTLEDQIRYPLMHPREMRNTPNRAVAYLAADPVYRAMFKEAFGSDAIVWDWVAKAIASFERTLLTGNSPFDRFVAGFQSALTDAARRGFDLFRGRAGCIGCHAYSKDAPFFTDFEFHNTGLGWAASPDLGRYEISKEREDKGAFRTPTLRNVAGTGPYMHDGRMGSLEEVVEFYAGGGEVNPFLDRRIHPLDLSAQDKSDLVAFLVSLTGEVTFKPTAAAQTSPADPPGVSQRSQASDRAPELLPVVHPPFARVELIAGGGDNGDGGKATDASFVGIGGLAVDAQGDVYLADACANRVRRIDARSGTIRTVAGNGFLFGPAQPAAATAAALPSPVAVAVDPRGRSLFIGEIIGRRVQRVDLTTGRIADLGAPRGGFGEPTGLAWSSAGLLVADPRRGQIWRLQPDGGWVGLLPDVLRLRGGIRSLVEDRQGRIYIAEYFAHRVLRWDPASGQLELAAGTGEPGRVADGAQASQSPLRSPDGLALDRDGNLLIADKGNHRIVRVDVTSGRLTTLVEAGRQGSDERWTPGPLAFDADGVLWIGDIHRNRLMRYVPGAARPALVAGAGGLREQEQAVGSVLAHPGAVAADAGGNVFVSDTLHHRVRMIAKGSGVIRTIAGTGVPGFNGDGMPATEAWLGYPGKLGLDGLGRLYIGDYYNNRVRRVDPRTGFITTVAGSGRAGEYGDGGPAEKATLLNPHALAFDADGSLMIASAVSPKIRRVDLRSGRIDSVPMDSSVPATLVFYGLARWKDGFALASPRPGSIEFLKNGRITPLLGQSDVVFPQDVAVSPQGDLYICETGRNRILRWTGTQLDVVVENLGRPRSIGFDPDGNLLIADTFHNRVLRVIARGRQERP